MGPIDGPRGLWRLALRVRAPYEGAGYPVPAEGQRSYDLAGLMTTVEVMLDAGSEL